MVTLPDAPWRRGDEINALIEALHGARFVGGCVRDALLGIVPADIDLATPLPPDAVMAALRDAGIKAVPTGLAHGTITAVLPTGPVEVTTLRRDVETDGRHAVVAYTYDWREDAARRDFTINALSADPRDGTIYDYFDGLADLARCNVRFIGDPLQRIAEDHLRILRFFRFLARFGDTPDPDGLRACTERANDLMALSRERIRDEVLKLLVARDAVRVMALMLDHGILRPVLPEITTAEPLAILAGREVAAGIAPDALRRLVALLPPEVVESVAARLKLSNADRKRMTIAAVPGGDMAGQEIAYRFGTVAAVDRVLLSSRPVEEASIIVAWPRPTLPVSGGDLVQRGLAKGPVVARTLRTIEDQWIARGFVASPAFDAIVDAAVDQALRAERS